jgi:hypothetical protein
MKEWCKRVSWWGVWVVLAVWQLPQTVVALLLLAGYRWRGATVERCLTGGWKHIVRTTVQDRAWSLGLFIFVGPRVPGMVLRHERGHSVQSLYLGPLYLLAVGLPSAVLFYYRRWRKKDANWYHSKYPEAWADRCGQVPAEFDWNTGKLPSAAPAGQPPHPVRNLPKVLRAQLPQSQHKIRLNRKLWRGRHR